MSAIVRACAARCTFCTVEKQQKKAFYTFFLLDTEGSRQTAGVSHQDFLPQELPALLSYYILQLYVDSQWKRSEEQVVHSGVFLAFSTNSVGR